MAGKKKTEEQLAYEEMQKVIKNDKSVCKMNGKTYKVGQSWREKGTCEVRVCHPGGVISVMECPKFLYDKKKPRPNCQVVPVDTELEYPECCEYIHCTPSDQKST